MKMLFASKPKYDEKMNEYLLSYLEKKIVQLERRVVTFNNDLQEKIWIGNTSIAHRYIDNTTETLEEQLKYVLGLLEGLYHLNFYYLLEGFMDHNESLVKKLDLQTKRLTVLNSIIQKPILKEIQFTNDSSLNQILTRMAENASMTSSDIKSVYHVSLESFLKDLVTIPSNTKQRAYQRLICEYINDCKNNKFASSSYSTEIAEQIHNLVYFSYNDFIHFEDDIFWKDVFASKVKTYILENFIIEIFRSQPTKDRVIY